MFCCTVADPNLQMKKLIPIHLITAKNFVILGSHHENIGRKLPSYKKISMPGDGKNIINIIRFYILIYLILRHLRFYFF